MKTRLLCGSGLASQRTACISLPRWSRTLHGASRHWQSGGDDCSDSTRKRWSTRPLLCDGAKSKRNHRARATQSRNASNTQHHLTHQQATPHSKWHELAQEYRSSSVSRDASISPHRERDQGSFTTIRRRRQRLCEGITGRAIVVMTIASRWREASIVFRDPTARRVERGSSNEVARYADLDAEHSMSAKEPF